MSSPNRVKTDLENCASRLITGQASGASSSLNDAARSLKAVLDDYENRIRKLEKQARKG